MSDVPEMGGLRGLAAPAAKRRSISRLQFIIGGLVCAFILLLSTFLAFRLSSEDAILDDMADVIRSVSNETVANTESFLAPAERTAEQLTRLVEVGHLDSGEGLATGEYFFEVLRVHEAFDAVFLGRPDGSFLYVSRSEADGYSTKEIFFDGDARVVQTTEFTENHEPLETTFDPQDEYDPRTRPWFNRATNAADGAGVWTAPYVFFSSGLPGVTRAQSSSSPSGDRVVVGIDIQIDSLSTFMAERRASPNGTSFILDRELNVVAHPNNQLTSGSTLANVSELDDPILSFAGSRIQSSPTSAIDELSNDMVGEEDSHFALRSLANNPDWVVAVTSPDDDFLGSVRVEQQTTRAISALGGLIATVLLVVGGRVINTRYRRERALAETALSEAEARSEERDAARATLSQTVDELARSNADLEEYAYATAHDLRTPLRAIGGYAELLLRESEDGADSEEMTDYARNIVSSYERMCSTMDNLLEHARATVHEPVAEAIPLTPVVNDALIDFRDEIERCKAQVTVGSLPEAAVHPIAMRRVFQNLISNAMKYRHPDRTPTVEIRGHRQGASSIISVRDNGVGIPPEQQDEVFRLFNRLSTDASGSGIGLALVKKLVEEHQGSVTLDSISGEGSTFTITLPSKPAAAEDARTTNPAVRR